MKTEVIGDKSFHYSNIKDLFYYVAKTYYLDYDRYFTAILLKTGDKKENAVYIDIDKKGHSGIYVDMSPLKYDEWSWIVSKLKKDLPSIKIESFWENSVTVNRTEEVNQLFRDKLKKIRLNTVIPKLLKRAPVDDYGFSEIVYFKDFDSTNPEESALIPSNGVHWDRSVKLMFNIEYFKEKGKTIGFKFNGFNINNEEKNRLIRPDIRTTFDKCRCSHCWSPNEWSKKHEIDHKNGRYNKNKVFRFDTQQIDDFQTLCQSDNKLKRTCCSKCKETGIRFDATFLGYNISVTEGTREYNEELGCVGCYWHDCNDFKSKLGTIEIKTNE
jgi:hypothetical protein